MRPFKVKKGPKINAFTSDKRGQSPAPAGFEPVFLTDLLRTFVWYSWGSRSQSHKIILLRWG